MVIEGTLARAQAGDQEAFRELTAPYRAELLVHCYQILGSVQDAEDMLQETLLAAWRGLSSFEGRSSLRSWLHKIAVNGCLNALRDRSRRPREVPLAAEPPQPTRLADPVWLEPYPDVLLEGVPDLAPGPEARYDAKESIQRCLPCGWGQLRENWAILGGGGTSAPLDEYGVDTTDGLREAKVFTKANRPIPGTAAGTFTRAAADAVEDAIWSAMRDPATGYGVAVFDLDPGEPGGETSITVTYYHAVGADPANPNTGTAGAPNPDYTPFETFTLVRPRSDGHGRRGRAAASGTASHAG